MSRHKLVLNTTDLVAGYDYTMVVIKAMVEQLLNEQLVEVETYCCFEEGHKTQRVDIYTSPKEVG